VWRWGVVGAEAAGSEDMQKKVACRGRWSTGGGWRFIRRGPLADCFRGRRARDSKILSARDRRAGCAAARCIPDLSTYLGYVWEKRRGRANNAVFAHPCTDPRTLPCLGCGGTRCLGCRAPASRCGVPSYHMHDVERPAHNWSASGFPDCRFR